MPSCGVRHLPSAGGTTTDLPVARATPPTFGVLVVLELAH